MRSPRLALAAIGLGLASAAPVARAADAPDHPVVAGFERAFAAPGAAADPRAGRLLIGELNCTACHRAEGPMAAALVAKPAPVLDAIGERAKVDHLRAYLAAPHATKPGTTMPDLLGALPEPGRGETAEAIVHFLAGTGRVTASPLDRRAVARGRAAYREVGCVACHGAREEGSPVDALATTVPLGPLSSKYTIGGLAAFLLDPHKARPSGRMPGMGLSPRAARDVANFLLLDLATTAAPNVKFAVFDGSWEKLPDFGAMAPAATGEVFGVDLAAAKRRNNYGVRFEGYFHADREDEYEFRTTSDDGSVLRVDGEKVVDNDGIHPESPASGRVKLGVGPHKVVVDYFDGGGQTSLAVEVEGGGLRLQSIDAWLTLTDAPPRPEGSAAPLAIDAGLAEKGRTAFASVGCASCHRLERAGSAVDPTMIAPALASLKDAAAGCLAPEPRAGLPNYRLNDAQRAAIASALGSAEIPEGPKAAIERTALAMNCVACHRRDGLGGVEDARNPYFETTHKEIGDEGRIPPALDGVGAKLTRAWMDHILADGAKDRPYMKTRMPKFGAEVVGHLAAAFEAADPTVPAGPVPDFGVPERRVKSDARHLVGTLAFGCVNCHNFAGEASQGIPALDMALMTRRLRRDWFVRYVVDPQSFRPGTRMPTSWPEPASVLPAILDGRSRTQIEAVWSYLSDGTSAAKPYGIGRPPIPLVAEGEAVVYRNFIEGSGPRAIGVGYPEKVNVAFDANSLRLSLAWHGGFMDASRHWVGRGEGYQPPMGDEVVKLPGGTSLARLDAADSPWPDPLEKGPGRRFRGYRLSKDGRPTFAYDLGPIRVEDFPTGVAPADPRQPPTLRRSLTLTTPEPVPNLYYRLAVGSKIEALPDGWFSVDGEWKTRLDGPTAPILRDSAGRKELIAPVPFEAGKAAVTQVIGW